MGTKNEILSYFQEMNIELDDKTLNKCVEMCLNYNLGAEDFCDQWYAYTASNLNGAAPSIEYLERLERSKDFQKNNQFAKQAVSVLKSTLLENTDGKESTENAGSASSGTPKATRRDQPQLHMYEATNTSKNLPSSNKSNEGSSTSPAERYAGRPDARSVQCSYGSCESQFKRKSDHPVVIENTNKYENVKYMYDIMLKKRQHLNSTAQRLGKAILEKHHLTPTEGTIRNNLGEVTTFGRVVSDCDGKINFMSVLLEGTLETNMGYPISLNLTRVSKCSLFPGQVVGVHGNCINSNTLIAEKIFTDSPLDFPREPPITDEPLQIVAASGPFTLDSDLSYKPLHDLVKYVQEYEPHVLILLGPFVEASHKGVHLNTIPSYDTFFAEIVDNLMHSLKNIDIQVVIVSSQKDGHHDPLYPTPPYPEKNLKQKHKNLTFVCDPCMLNINGVYIASTTPDILFHLSNFEIHVDKNSSGPVDRMGRIASHLLDQQTFYPLYPPWKDMCIDYNMLSNFGIFQCKPHILILPSNLRYFIKNVQDCLVINPERLSKGDVGGTFARIEIGPGQSRSICGRTACHILKI